MVLPPAIYLVGKLKEMGMKRRTVDLDWFERGMKRLERSILVGPRGSEGAGKECIVRVPLRSGGGDDLVDIAK